MLQCFQNFQTIHIDVTILATRNLTSTHSFPGFCFPEGILHLVNGIFQKKISTFPKFQFVKVDGAIPIASGNGGISELEMGGFGKPASPTNSVRDPVLY